jgi:hypothetical protein
MVSIMEYSLYGILLQFAIQLSYVAFYSGPFGSFLCADHICNSHDFPLIFFCEIHLSAKGHVDRFDDVAFVYYGGRVVSDVDKPVVEFNYHVVANGLIQDSQEFLDRAAGWDFQLDPA